MPPALTRRGLALVSSLGVALALSNCSGKHKGGISTGNWAREAAIVEVGSKRTPPHNLSRYEYPFHDAGNYIAAWAAAGERNRGQRSSWASRSSSSSSHSSSTYRKPASTRPTPTYTRPTPTYTRPTPPPTKPRPASTKPTPPKKPAYRSHLVTSSDTLYSLSRRYGVSIARIQAANGLKSTLIRTGATLRVPY